MRDDIGYRARRAAEKEEELFRQSRHRGADGQYTPVENAEPIDFVGGLHPNLVADRFEMGTFPDRARPQRSASTFVSSSPNNRLSFGIPPSHVPAESAYLQVMCGPLLRYDTVDSNKVWRGAVMLVTADAGSHYDPHPMLFLEWNETQRQHRKSNSVPNGESSYRPPTRPRTEAVPGQAIYVYHGASGSFSFWRFLIEVPLGMHEMSVRYALNQGATSEFFVPGSTQNMRWAAHSCNGFSSGINPDDFKTSAFETGFDPVWCDLLEKHAENPFHVLVGGGDQIYCDSITREPELQDWLATKKVSDRMACPATDEIKSAMDRFYFNHYCLHFRRGAFARANRSIPMLNMLDDHDLIDGYGSYPEELMTSPIFSTIGSRGYFWFLLFQLFTVDDVDGTTTINSSPGSHTFISTIIGGAGAYVPYPSHSVLAYLGPQAHILLMDCRAERTLSQICSPETYDHLFQQIAKLPPTTEHLIFLLGIPIAYPRMNFMEKALGSKFNPVMALAKNGTTFAGLTNKFNSEAELLDDLNDHWTAGGHKKERNAFVERCQALARDQRLRITFVSGDVHCAAVGAFKTLSQGRASQLGNSGNTSAAHDPRYMLNIVTSAIVNTPPPPTVLRMVNSLSEKKHKTMHGAATDETMIPLFLKNPDGTASKHKYVYGARNYTKVLWDDKTGELEFDIRIEKQRGHGTTVGYVIRAPRPLWT